MQKNKSPTVEKSIPANSSVVFASNNISPFLLYPLIWIFSQSLLQFLVDWKRLHPSDSVTEAQGPGSVKYFPNDHVDSVMGT